MNKAENKKLDSYLFYLPQELARDSDPYQERDKMKDFCFLVPRSMNNGAILTREEMNDSLE